MQKRKILLLCPYPFGTAPSQRFRFEQYLDQLHSKGYSVVMASFFDKQMGDILHSRGHHFQKAIGIIKGYLSRFGRLFSLHQFEFVFIHREAAPAGPPVFEWMIAKIFRKKIIYDFDDAIWLTDVTGESRIVKVMRWRSKVSGICKWAHRVSCGNHYLLAYAKQYNPNVFLIPTTIDTKNWHNPSLIPDRKKAGRVVIGWTGSHSTLKYLAPLASVLNRISGKYPQVSFSIIADQPPAISIPSLEFVPWSTEREIADLRKFDIGIMPLPDDEWTRGKCGFKALQYMAMEIPVVLSPVGVNNTIVAHGVTGFHARSDNEWFMYLSQLIEDHDLRKRMGTRGRQEIILNYSVSSNTSAFLSLFT